MPKIASPDRNRNLTPMTWALAALSLLGYVFFHYFVVRLDLCDGSFRDINLGRFIWTPLLFHAAMFAAFGLLYQQCGAERQVRQMIVFGIVCRAALLFSMPNFSDDVWRFLWDGRMTVEGINPYLFTPHQALRQLGGAFGSDSIYQEIFSHLNSKDYYSVYPPLLQYAFALSALCFPSSILGQTVLLKLLILVAEAGSLFFLAKLIKEFKLSSKFILLYAINPFVITELAGNLHFEALMICFTLGALYFLTKGRNLRAAGFLALAVSAKLLPFLFWPFVARRLGVKRFLSFTAFYFVILILLFFPIFGAEQHDHMRESLKLYFHCFEFNGGLFRLAKHFFEPDNVWRLQEWSGRVVGAVIVLMVFRDRDRTMKGLAVSWMVALGFYQLCAAAIHPWYITPLVALAVLGVFRWPLLWGFLLTLTYGFYYLPAFEQPAWALWLEYTPLWVFILYELLFKSRALTLEDLMHRSKLFYSLYRRTLPKRLSIRERRLMKLLVPGERVLDIGTGNGALCLSVKNRGFDVTPTDVKDVSFFSEVTPLIIDGAHLPFADQSFDTALLITVLHHTKAPETLLKEAARVAKRLIVMEDIHRNRLQKWFTQFTDSLVNMEFKDHPHNNRGDVQWRETFSRMGKSVTHAEDFRTLLFFRQVIYVVE